MRRLLRGLERLRRSRGEQFRRLAAELSRRYPGYTIVLFGSRARGGAGPLSDYDIAVVAPQPDCLDKPGLASRILSVRSVLGLWGLELDVVVLCPDELGDPIVRGMLEGCLVIHDGLGVAGRLPCRGWLRLEDSG